MTSHYLDWDHVNAEKWYRRSIELDPHASFAASAFAEYLLDMRSFDEALIYAKRAQDADPWWLEAITVAGNIHCYAGNADLAIAEYDRALEIEPGHGLTNHFLGRAYLSKRWFGRAIQQLRRSDELLGHVPFSRADLGYALALGGERLEAERMLAELVHRPKNHYFPAFAIAEIQLGLGDFSAALDSLEAATDERNLGYYLPSIDPIYDPLRDHPRFQALMRRIRCLTAVGTKGDTPRARGK